MRSAKAAEDCRSPKAGAGSGSPGQREASWTALQCAAFGLADWNPEARKHPTAHPLPKRQGTGAVQKLAQVPAASATYLVAGGRGCLPTSERSGSGIEGDVLKLREAVEWSNAQARVALAMVPPALRNLCCRCST